MSLIQFQKLSKEILDLLDRQVEAVSGRSFSDLSQEEKDAYEIRKRRIQELKTALDRLQKLQ